MLAFLYERERIEVDGTIANRYMCTILALLTWDGADSGSNCKLLQQIIF
jgi:hypothetical protein